MNDPFTLNLFTEKILSGITFLDFSRLLPGPLGTASMAQMGAKMIKVEYPAMKDWLKTYGVEDNQSSYLYNSLNGNKFVKSLDLIDDYDKIIELIKNADVFIEQFRPGVMKSFNLDYDTIARVKPNIIYISLTGYGQHSDLAGHDINYFAESGLLSLNVDENGKPVIPGFQLADVAGGSYPLIMACLGALYYRAATGKGQYIDVSFTSCLKPLLALPFGIQQAGIRRRKLLKGGQVNYNVYQTLDGRWMALGALEIKFWNRFCELVDKPNWKRDQSEELSVDCFSKPEIELLFRSKLFNEWCNIAKDKNICLSPVWNFEDEEWSEKISRSINFN